MSILFSNETIKSFNNSIIVNDSNLNSNDDDYNGSKLSLGNNDINQLEKDISNIMKSNKYNVDNNKTDTFKEFIISLHGHITSLIEEVKILHEYSIKKSIIIINLIDMAHKDKNNDDHMTS